MIAGLVPEGAYEQMPNWLLWVLVGVSLRFLAYGADRLVTGAVHLARTMGISTVVIGATIVSLGTTSPEAFVSVTAAFRGQSDLALGNAVGSIICDTAFIFGLSLVLTRLPLDRFVLYRQGLLKLATGFLLIVTVFLLAWRSGGFEGVVIPRHVGLLYVVLLVGYMYVSVRWTRAHPQAIPHEARVQPPKEHRLGSGLLDMLVLLDGLLIVYVTCNILIGSVSNLCLRYRVPPDVLAVTVVAIGTSLPELVTALASIAKGHPELLIGNVIGADILNVLFVTGLSATASPLQVAPSFYYLHLPVMAGSLLLMGAYVFVSGKTFRRWQGLPLLALYAVYLVLIRTYLIKV